MPSMAKLVGALTLVAVTWGVNAPTFEYGFVYDDRANIIEREPAWEQGWLEFLRTRHWGTGRHAVLLSFDLNRRQPLDPRPFRVTNTLVAAVVTVLVYGLAMALGLGCFASFAAGLLFSVHPIHVDAVVAVAGRAELMAAAGVLACLLLHISNYKPRGFGLTLAGLLFFGALSSKESAAALLLILPLHDWLLGKDSAVRFSLAVYSAYALALAAWLLLVLPNLSELAPVTYVDNPLAHMTWDQRIPRAAEVLWRYLSLVVWPSELRPDRSHADTVTSLGAGIAAVAAWLATLALAYGLRRRYPLAAFAWLWFPAAFVTTANVILPVGTIMAERLTLLPSVGICLLSGLVVDRASAGRRGLAVLTGFAVAVVAFVFAFAYDSRARVWRDDDHYHTIAAVESPRSAKTHYNLGLVRARQGRMHQALASFNRALAIYPGFSRATYYAAAILAERGQLDEAAAMYRSYLDERPDDAGALSQLAALEIRRGRPQQALDAARRMVELEPANPAYRATLDRLERLGATRQVNP